MVISGDFLFIGLAIMGMFFTWMSSTRRAILLAFSGSLVWFSLAMWLWFSSTPLFGLTENWSRILVWVFIILTFVPWLLFADTEVRHEARSKTGSSTWVEYEKTPKVQHMSASEKYQIELHNRMEGVRKIRKRGY